MASQQKFRSRKIDLKKPLPILHAEDLPDLDDDLHRRTMGIATGVDKEEEEEHHLQAVISATQVKDSPQKTSVYIPTPDASQIVDFYSEHYNQTFRMPKSYIRFSNIVEECVGPSYCMDEMDFSWFKNFNKTADPPITEDMLESVLNELENITNERQKITGTSLSLAELSDLDTFILIHPHSTFLKSHLSKIYEYWKQKRLQSPENAIIPAIRMDESLKSENDPFVCFRKREIKTTRKTRRTDAQSLQRLIQLKSELESARNLLEMVLKREKMRKESLLLDHAVFEQKILIRQMKDKLGIPDEVIEEARAAQKRALKLRSSPSINKEKGSTAKKRKMSIFGDEIVKDPISIAIENEIQIWKAADAKYNDLTESHISYSLNPASLYLENDIVIDKKENLQVIRGRRRIGRGGRLLFDQRIAKSSKFDPFDESSDEESFDYFSNKFLNYKIAHLASNIDFSQLSIRQQ